MRTIQELLADKPEALAHVEQLIAKHDVWVVGGAARALMYPMLPFPTDVDLLLNIEGLDGDSIGVALGAETGSGGQGQKQTVGEVKFDVFTNRLLVWLNGVPCHGDGLAVRASDGFALWTEKFSRGDWATIAIVPGSEKAINYLARHRASLQRDQQLVTSAFTDDIPEAL